MKIFSAFDEYLTAQEAADWCELQGLQNEIIRRTAFHKDRIGSETLNYSITALQSDMDLIVERALARHLELWAESLNENGDISLNKFGEFVYFDEESGTNELYNGFLYVENTDVPQYFSFPTRLSTQIQYIVLGDVVHDNIPENVIPYLKVNKWYVIESSVTGRLHLFNLDIQNPIAIETGDVTCKFASPINGISNMIKSGGIVSELQ